MAGTVLRVSGSRLTGQEAGNCDRGQDCDRNRIDKCGLAQTVVRCSKASEQGRNASRQVTDDVDRRDQPRPVLGRARGGRGAVGAHERGSEAEPCDRRADEQDG